MKLSARIKIYFGVLLFLGIVGVLLSGDVFLVPRGLSLLINGNTAEGIEISEGHIMLDAQILFEALGSDVRYQQKDDTLTVKYYGDTLKFKAGDVEYQHDDNKAFLSSAPVMLSGRIMLPVRSVSEALGCKVTWDSQLYIASIGEPPQRNSYHGVKLTDEYRYYKYNGTYSGFDIFGNGSEYICTENVDISRENCERYADLINDFAAEVPEAQTYAVLVPTSSEFYSSQERKSNYSESFGYIYSRLNRGVYGVNVAKPLSEHADERIYFNTDHHWTQLGAYYAYREFLNWGFDEIAAPDSFKKETLDYYQGSFLEYTWGTDGYKYLIDTYDKLEMYYPSVGYTGASYYDEKLSEYIGPMEAIDTKFQNYDCFMDGDYPIEVYKTDNKNGRRICIIKDSFGNAFAVWALNNYEEVYVVDYRRFNNYSGDSESYREFKISDFYKTAPFDDLVILSYPVTIASEAELKALEAMQKR